LEALAGPNGRNRDCAPRLAARKPRRTDVRRPAPEGANKNFGAKRRKAERPPELMRGKPSSADALRPALEGENKESTS
jgi:hypothetical protein